MTKPTQSDLDETWADTLHRMNVDAAQPGPSSMITVPCPQCGAPVAIIPDQKMTVATKPELTGPGWQSVRVSVTASGTAVHTHSVNT